MAAKRIQLPYARAPISEIYLASVASGNMYVFYLVAGGPFVYVKSTDNGLTWENPVAVSTTTSGQDIAIWYDRWTSGDSGNLIHIVYLETATDDVRYRNLDVSSDTLSTEVVVFDGASFTGTAHWATICKTRGGNLLIGFDGDGGTEDGFYRSTDGGGTWGSLTSWAEGSDWAKILPGNYADNQDADIIFWDRSANEISLKVYDDSAGTTSETSISGSMNDIATPNNFDCMVRHSDGHVILIAWSENDSATADLRAWDIDGSGSITALTDVVSNSDDCGRAALFIDQSNDTLYAFYVGKSDGSETLGTATGVYYKTSTDDGATWSSEQTLSTEQGPYDYLACTRSASSSTSLVATLYQTTIVATALNSAAVFPDVTTGGGGGGTSGGWWGS